MYLAQESTQLINWVCLLLGSLTETYPAIP